MPQRYIGVVAQIFSVKLQKIIQLEKTMKKTHVIILLICLIVLSCIFSACDGLFDDGKLKVVTTIFPVYDWTLNILGDHSDEYKVTNLLNSSVDMHSYQPSPNDIVTIASCDLFIYVGGESDEWVEGALKRAVNKDMIVVNVLDVIADSALEEEDKEGMQGEDEDEDEGAYDEHFWMSLRRAKTVVDVISQKLSALDLDNAADYAANAAAYAEQLDALDAEYAEATENAANKTFVVADRFPFLYLFNDYGLDYYAAFRGCAAATEVSPNTIVFLINKMKELQAKCIIKTESRDDKLAKTIINELDDRNVAILTLNSLQSAGASDRNKGVSYLSLMRENLSVLRQALN